MMLIPYRYAYLVGALIFMIPWIILYWHRKDLRREMIGMSIIFAAAGYASEHFWWTLDWWRPETITSTRAGIEDIILGFGNGGVAAVLYEGVFNRVGYHRYLVKHNFAVIIIPLILFHAISYLILFFNFTSYLAFTFALIISTVVLLIIRKDLFMSSLLNGILMVIVSLPVYYTLILFSPGWIDRTWLYSNLSAIKFVGIPIEDYVFYFLTGFFVAPLYEYWQGIELRRVSSVKGKIKRRR